MIGFIYILRGKHGLTKIGISTRGNLKPRVRSISHDLRKYEQKAIRHKYTFRLFFYERIEKRLLKRFQAHRAPISDKVNGYTEFLYLSRTQRIWLYCELLRIFITQVSIILSIIALSFLFISSSFSSPIAFI